jgi:uncharacterized protein YyaL (SSP411 family)
MRRALDRAYAPNRVVVFRPDDDPERIARLAPYTRGQVSQGGVATAYVCRNFACERPTTDAGEMLRALGGGGPERNLGD